MKVNEKKYLSILTISVLILSGFMIAVLVDFTHADEPRSYVGKIAFSSNMAGNRDIWVTDEDGTNLDQLTTDPGEDWHMTWSPDGEKIAFMSDRTGNWDIWVMDSDGSNQVQLTTDPDDDWSPAWSPDGSKIAFMSIRVGRWDVWIMDPDGSNQVQLTTDPNDDGAPEWSPDSKKIAFVSNRAGGQDDIWVMDSDGSNQVQLTNGNFDWYPDWSPDGKKIAFYSDKAGNWDIWVMDTDGSNQIQLTTDPSSDMGPTWSPDGERIAFASNRAGNYDIWVMNADGSNQIQLTPLVSRDDTPHWWGNVSFLPDLKVTRSDIVFNPPGPVSNGTVINIIATIHNSGAGNASDVIVRFYDGDPGYPPGSGPGVQIDMDQFLPSIPAGENRTAQVTWTANPLGIHNIYVVADPLDTIGESNETNNIANNTIEVINPDYIPWDPPSPQQKVSMGSSIIISSRVKNVGIVNSSVVSTIAFYNQSTPLSPFEIYSVPPLNISEISEEYNAMWISPTTEGIYNVVIEVDFDNDIEEPNEENNTYVIEFNVVAKPVTTIHVDTPQYGGPPLYVNSSTEFWFSVIDYSGTGYNTYYYIDAPPFVLYTGPFILPTEGEHVIYFYSIDNLSGVEDTKSYTVRVDNTPPDTTLTVGTPKYRSSPTYVNSSTEFNLTATDGTGSGVASVWYKIDTGSWSLYTGNFTILTPGSHTIYYNSTDNLGQNELTKSYDIIVDNTPTETILTVGEPKYDSSPTYVNSTTMFNLTATDDTGLSVACIWYKINADSWTLYTENFTLSIPGSHTIFYKSTDNLGQIETTKSYDVFVDNSPPSTTLTIGNPKYSSSPTYVNSTTVFNFKASDGTGSGVASIWYKIDSGSWILYTGDLTVSTPGTHTIHYYSTDNLGQDEVIKSYAIIVDNTPPITSINVSLPKYVSDDVWVTSATEFTLDATDSGLIPVGINRTMYRIWSGTWSDWEICQNEFTLGVNEGIRYVEFYSVDWLGNVERINNRTYIVDNTPPTTAIGMGLPKYDSEDIWVTSDTLFTIDATDNGLIPVGIDYTEYRVWNNGSWTSWTEYSNGFILDVDEGMTYVEFHSRDKLGNTESVQNRSYIVDNTPPTTTISVGDPRYKGSPNNIWNVTSATTFALSAIDHGVGQNYTEYRIWNNGNWSEWYRYPEGFRLGSGNGTRYVEWYSVDYLGNIEMTHNQTYFVDNIPPETNYLLQLEPDNTEARISLIPSDVGSGVNFTRYRIDSGDWVVYSDTFIINESGLHTIYFFSADKLGNVEKTNEVSVLVEEPETPPSDADKKETNHKPLIALIFAIILLIIGSMVAKKRPLVSKIKKLSNEMFTFFTAVLPFVIAEIITGIISWLTGALRVPSWLGIGMFVDLAILIGGFVVYLVVYEKRTSVKSSISLKMGG